MPKSITLLVGAEGVSETLEQDWIREATDEEVDAFEAGFKHATPEEFAALWIDHNGRPYYLMTVLPHAPILAWDKAEKFTRVIRLC